MAKRRLISQKMRKNDYKKITKKRRKKDKGQKVLKRGDYKKKQKCTKVTKNIVKQIRKQRTKK